MGLTQSDGGFFLLVKGIEPLLNPVVKLASLTNTDTLQIVTHGLTT
jgi:hypothetical protein